MENILKKSDEKSFLYSKNKIVTEVNNDFINLTGYSNNELIGKSLTEISIMLKIDSQVHLENIESEYSCYMFTKEYDPIEVTISCKSLDFQNERIYFIKEKPNSNIKEKFPYVEHLYSSSQIAVAIYSLPDLIVLRMNDMYLEVLDAPYNKRENVIGKNKIKTMFGYEGSNEEEILLSNIKSGKPSYEKEFKYEHFERGTTYWDISLVPISIDGKEKYLVGTTTDVTEKVMNSKLVKKQKEELETIIENTSDQVIFINKNGDYTGMNKRAKDNYLYDFTTLKNNQTAFKQAEYFDIDGNLILYENTPVQRVIIGEKISRYIVMEKNKKAITYTEVTGTPIHDKAGDFIGGVMIYRDITAGMKNQENLLLKAQSKTLRNIMENLELGCTIASYPDFNIKYINNKSYIRLKKINPKVKLASITGKNIFDMFKYNMNERTKAEINVENLIEKKSSSCFYYKKHIEAGEEKFFKIKCQALFGLKNVVTEIIFITIDITEEIKAKNKMEETLKMQDEIFSNISHELKTPLNVIFSTNQLMQLYLKSNLWDANKEKISRSINIIKQNCHRFTKIINNTIDISKIESGFLKLNLSNENIVNITEEIIQSIAEYIKGKGINITFDTNTEEKIIACDPDKIERIILNLISNAVKFTNTSGSIFVNILDKGDTVEISVKDTGIGMDKKHLDNIFKRFHQVDKSLSRNAEGSGIGLSLVKSIVELHGGKISAESNINEGSIFKIELPAMTIESPKVTPENKAINSKIEMINIEFSDIYSI